MTAPAEGPDASGRLAEVVALVEAGRQVRGRVLLDRGLLLARLDAVRSELAAELRGAREVLRDRDAVVEEGRREVERLRREAAAAEPAQPAPAAEAPPAPTDPEHERLLAEAGEFAERSLAELEAVLQRVLAAIIRARGRLFDEGGRLRAGDLRRALVEEE